MINKFTSLIKDDYIKWQQGDNIILDGGTGSGKTYFILNVLQPYCSNNNKTILYLCNRTYLREQIQDEIIYKNLINIDILNYQILEQDLNKGRCIKQYDYIVADECHYFSNDALFNIYTDLSYDYVINNGYNNSTVIYMSATSFDLFNKLKLEKKVKPENYYKIDIDYNYVDNLIFYTKKDLTSIIDDILKNTDDKIIYFCNSLERAKNIYDKYKQDANFISSKWNPASKNYNQENCIKIYDKNLITFDKRVLIATKALDNGIDIIDGKIKHIISDIIDVDSMQQCLGRKRIINNHRCNFYIRNYTKSDLQLFKNNINKELNPVILFKNNFDEFINFYGKNRNYKNACIYYDWTTQQWRINNVRTQKLLLDINNIEGMFYYGYQTFIINRLGDTLNNIKDYKTIKDQIKKNNTDKYLKAMIDKNIKLLKDDQIKLANIIDLRDKKNRQKKSYKVLNKYLKVNKLPYLIISKHSTKIINNKKKSYRYWEIEKII